MRLVITSIVLSLFLTASCITNPETGESSLAFMPEAYMNDMGLQAYQEVLTTERVHADARWQGIVTRVCERIAAAAEAKAHVGYDWQFTLVDNPQANAFCLPGGKIMIYSGILDVARTEAGLAFVVGHEVAHAIAQHANQRISTNITLQVGLLATDAALAENEYRDGILMAMAVGSKYGAELPFSRSHESEADRMGLTYMARAGYDPAGAIGFWGRMGAGGGQPPEWQSTHPSHEKREAQIQAMVEELRAGEYQQAPDKLGFGENL